MLDIMRENVKLNDLSSSITVLELNWLAFRPFSAVLPVEDNSTINRVLIYLHLHSDLAL